MRVQAVEMTRNNRAWKSQMRDSHIPTASTASTLRHNNSTSAYRFECDACRCHTFSCIKSAVVVLSRCLRFQHTERRLEDSMKLAIDPANYLIEICTAKDDVLRTWELLTLHPFQG